MLYIIALDLHRAIGLVFKTYGTHSYQKLVTLMVPMEDIFNLLYKKEH